MSNNELSDLGMNLKVVDIDTLEPALFNPGEHPEQQRQEIQRAQGQFKQYKNIVVWRGQVIAGKGVLESFKEKGVKRIVVNDRSDLSEDEAKALSIADRALPFLGETNPEILQETLTSVPDAINIPGVTPNWLESLGLFDETSIDLADLAVTHEDDEAGRSQYTTTCPKCGFEWVP